ncbi:MAG: hypothetical protein RIB47_12370 [Cyclobacteriaceae bacterium]
MRKTRLHIALAYLLGGCLLFGQLGATFFHTLHDEHKASITIDNQTSIVPHGEHCNICGIDMFNKHFDVQNRSLEFSFPALVYLVAGDSLKANASDSYAKDRAPPVQFV